MNSESIKFCYCFYNFRPLVISAWTQMAIQCHSWTPNCLQVLDLQTQNMYKYVTGKVVAHKKTVSMCMICKGQRCFDLTSDHQNKRMLSCKNSKLGRLVGFVLQICNFCQFAKIQVTIIFELVLSLSYLLLHMSLVLTVLICEWSLTLDLGITTDILYGHSPFIICVGKYQKSSKHVNNLSPVYS